jgi:two-component system alkaline phosphatase synthesis response regulator PhoP
MIYCVEDDFGIRNMMVYTLNTAGLDAVGFEDAESFYRAMGECLPNLVILDLMLPGGEDGLSILANLRKNCSTMTIPVIIATAKGTEYDKVVGLDSGADDYLVKPFGMMEMVSRVKAVLRRSQKQGGGLLKIKDLELDDNKHIVTAKGEKVELTLKEYEILRLLMQNAGQVFSRDKILSYIWGVDFFGETRTVDVHIGTLRTKIGACGDYIQTVRGVGYKMESEQ